MRNHVGYRGTDFTAIEGSDPDHEAPIAPIMVDGVMYLPASESAFASLSPEQGGVGAPAKIYGMLLVRIGKMGMNVPMTAPTLREYATRMLACAEEIEAGAKAKAEAVVATVTGKSRT